MGIKFIKKGDLKDYARELSRARLQEILMKSKFVPCIYGAGNVLEVTWNMTENREHIIVR